MTYTAVGSLTGASNSGALASFSLTTHTVGNFVLVEVFSEGGTRFPTALSSSNCTWATLGTPFTATIRNDRIQVFIGTVTAASTATVTITWGSGTTGAFETCAFQEFSTTTGIPVLDKQGNLDSGGTNTWPSLTPTAAGELYFGFSGNSGSGAVAGTTSGYTWNANVDGGGNGAAYNPNCGATATGPVWGDSGQANGIMVLVMPSGGGGGGSSGVTQVGTPAAPTVQSGSNTGAVTPSAYGTGQTDVAGDLLVCTVTAYGSTTAGAITESSGTWTKAVGDNTQARTSSAVFYKVAAGSDTLPTFNCTMTGTATHSRMTVQLFQFHGQDPTTPIDLSNGIGTADSASATSLTVTSAGNIPVAGCYALTSTCEGNSATATLTFTRSTSWVNAGNTGSTSTYAHSSFDTFSGPASGAALSNAVGGWSATNGAASVMVVIKPPSSSASGSLSISGTAAANQPLSASGALSLTGTATAKARATATGTITLTGTVPATVPYITGIGGTGTGQYFQDNNGNPRLVVSGEDWGLLANGGAWNSGNYQSTYDTYFAQRQAQGYTAVEVTMFSYPGANQVFPFTDGRDWDGVWPFNSTNNPSSGFNNTFWARRDYLLNSAKAHGITVLINVGTPALAIAGDMPAGWTTTQWTDYGTALGSRYASQPNVLWIVGDDYFGTVDTGLTAMLTALRAAGDTHPISYQAYQEATSRTDLFDGSHPAWGLAHAQFDWVYTYNVTYDGIEKAYAESSPIPVVWGDGFFLNSGTTGITDLNLIRRMVWWAISSGSRGWQVGDNNVWPWDSGAAAQITSNAWYTSQAPAIAAAFSALPGWHLLVPDTSSALVTSGRGTHASPIASGGGGTPYTSNSDSYVTASRTPDSGSGSSLAVIYMSHASTITIDQTKMVAGYTATWMDPASGATTSATTGSTYSSSGLGSNSVGDADWALILQGTPGSAATASGSLSLTGSATAKAPAVASGSLSIAGNATPRAAIVAPSGSLALTGTVAARASVSAAGSLTLLGTGPAGDIVTVIAGSLDISGTVTAAARATATGLLGIAGTATAVANAAASGSLSLAGTAVWQISAVSGSLSLTGTAAARAVATAAGSLTISGTAQPPGNNAAGSLSVSGTAAAVTPVTASGSISLTGTAVARTAVTVTGSISLASTAAAMAPATATGSLAISGIAVARVAITASGSISLAGAASAAGPGATAAGSISLAGTAIARVAVVTAGFLDISGTAVAVVRAIASGSLVINGTASAAGPGSTAAGSISLAGAVVVARAAIAASGSLAIAGAATARASAGTTGGMSLAGSVQAAVRISAIAVLAINGSVSAAASVSASGSFSIIGIAAAFVTVPSRDLNATVFADILSASISTDALSATFGTDELSAEVTGG